MPATTYPHIELSPEGVALVSGTRIKVVELVLERLAHHQDADEIHRQHPHLTLGQIHSALAYYHDHREEMDRELQRRLRREKELLRNVDDSDLRAKVRAARRDA